MYNWYEGQKVSKFQKDVSYVTSIRKKICGLHWVE